MPQSALIDIGPIALRHIDQPDGLQPGHHLLDRKPRHMIQPCQLPLTGQFIHDRLALKDLADEVGHNKIRLFCAHCNALPKFISSKRIPQSVQICKALW